MVIAVVLGSLAALGDRVTAAVVNRVIEVAFAFPVLLLALLLVAILGPSAGTQILAVGIGTAPGYARMVRGQILAERNAGYVEAARALGHPRGRIIAPAHPAERHAAPRRPVRAVDRAVDRLGVGPGVPRPRRRAALARSGARCWTPAARTSCRRRGSPSSPELVIVVLALAATTVGRRIQNHLEKSAVT